MASAQLLPRLNPPGAPADIPLVPTQLGFGMSVPALDPPANGVRFGPLVCARDVSQCLDTDVAAIDQNDRSVRTALQSYVAGTYGPIAVWSEPRFAIGPTTKSAAQFATDVAFRACHIATMTVMENAALANLDPAVRTSARVTEFASAAPPGSNELSVVRRRLLWQYERWTDVLQPMATAAGAPARPGYLDLPEFAAGIPGAAYNEYTAPSSGTISDARIEQLVRAGHELGFAYTRRIVGPLNGSIATASFTPATQHAVAVAGFDASQKYPVLIADVGTGTFYRAHIARLTDLAFVVDGGPVLPLTMPVGAPAAAPDPAYADRLAVLYEGVPPNETFVRPMQIFMLDAVMDLTTPQRSTR